MSGRTINDKKKAMNGCVHRLGHDLDRTCYSIFDSFQHLSQSHIMPRTLPVVLIILAACMGLPQHWGLLLTTAFLVAAFAVLLNSAIVPVPPTVLRSSAPVSRRACILTILAEMSRGFYEHGIIIRARKNFATEAQRRGARLGKR